MGIRRKKKKKAKLPIPPEVLAAKAAIRKLTPWVTTSFITTLIFFIWGLMLLSATFLPISILLIAMLAGGLLMLFLFRNRGALNNWDWSALLFIQFWFGASVAYFGVIALNFYGPRLPAETIQLSILDSGTSTSRGSKCKSPYAKVSYHNTEKSIGFACKDLELFQTARLIVLQVEKGMLGYYIYTEKDFIP